MPDKKPRLRVFINLNKLYYNRIIEFKGKYYAEINIGKNIYRNGESLWICINFLDGRKNNMVRFEERGLKKVTSDLVEKILEHLHSKMLDHAEGEYEKGENIDMYEEMHSSSPVSRFLYDNKEYRHMYLRNFTQRLKKFVTKLLAKEDKNV